MTADEKKRQLNARLADAVYGFRLADVRHCLDQGADPNLHHKDESLLNFAAAFDDGEILQLLIAYGARVDDSCKAEMTPLGCAMDAGAFDNAKILLAAGAQINAQARPGISPPALFHAALADSLHHTQSRTAFLLAKGADLTLPFTWTDTQHTILSVLRALHHQNSGVAPQRTERLLAMVEEKFTEQVQAEIARTRRECLGALLARRPAGRFKL